MDARLLAHIALSMGRLDFWNLNLTRDELVVWREMLKETK